MIELSVVIPCLDEAATIGDCVADALRGIESAGVVGEVVVADNGSRDGSAEIARSVGARVISAAERGYGAAIRAGIAEARGTYVIIGDADGEHDLTRLAPFLERLRDGDGLVLGNRFQGGIAPASLRWTHRYFGIPMLTAALNVLHGTRVGDAQCGMRGIARINFERIRAKTAGMEFASEMIVRARLLDLRISEVPTPQRRSGRGRPSHLRSVRDGFRHLRVILSLRFERFR